MGTPKVDYELEYPRSSGPSTRRLCTPRVVRSGLLPQLRGRRRSRDRAN